jgi:hypothetical protein
MIAHIGGARRPGGRSLRVAERGKSGLHGGAVPDNSRRGRPQGKCHRKHTAKPARGDPRRAARVKWCGKSAPRCRQRLAARKTPPGARPSRGGMVPRARDPASAAPGEPSRRRPGRLHEAPGDGRPRGMAAAAGGSRLRSSAVQNPAYTPSGAAHTQSQLFRPRAKVDRLAEEEGIIADFGGKPCELRVARLRRSLDRVECACVVEMRGFRDRDAAIGAMPAGKSPLRGPHAGG